MVVHRPRPRRLRLLLSDPVLAADALDLLRRRDLRDRFGNLALFILGENLVAERDALVADVYRRTRDELPNRVLRLAAERAAEVFVVGHLVTRDRETGCQLSRHVAPV